jgi:hypothetical protein
MNTGFTPILAGLCSWVPGSRAKPAPRNDPMSERIVFLRAEGLTVAIFASKSQAMLRRRMDHPAFSLPFPCQALGREKIFPARRARRIRSILIMMDVLEKWRPDTNFFPFFPV